MAVERQAFLAIATAVAVALCSMATTVLRLRMRQAWSFSSSTARTRSTSSHSSPSNNDDGRQSNQHGRRSNNFTQNGSLVGMDLMEALRNEQRLLGRWNEPTMNTETFTCDETIGGLHRLQIRLGLRRALNQSSANADQNVLTGHSEILSNNVASDTTPATEEQPEILMTDFGWMNATDPRQARSEPRTKWSALMQAAILDHPFYNPRGWAQIAEYERVFRGPDALVVWSG